MSLKRCLFNPAWAAIAVCALTVGCTGQAVKPGGDEWQPLSNGDRSSQQGSTVNNRREPGLPVAELFRRGNVAYRQGDLDGAETWFRRLLRRQPRHARATYNLSMIYLQRAYEGLRYFRELDANPAQRDLAQRFVRQLDALQAAQPTAPR